MMRFLSSWLGTQSPAFIWWVTKSQGRHVGTDAIGNRYYTGKNRPGYKNERRWVRYVGAPDSSTVPPEWHGWLHYQNDAIPDIAPPSFRKPWQKPHRSNLTGTNDAIFPEGFKHPGARPAATGDYEAWTPEN